jgi:TM2 domain-containing membrane protein YozV
MSVSNTAQFCSGCGASLTGGSAGTISDQGALTPRQSPVSALFTERPQQQTSSVTCVIHAFANAAGACVSCGNLHCRDCLVMYAGRNYCRNCATRLSGQLPQNIQQYPQQQPPQPYQYHQQPAPYGYPPAVTPYVKRKEPAVALLLSFFLPGLGQIYNGDVGKGIGMMFGFWILIWIGVGIVFWIWSMVDAYQSATNINLGRRV